MICIGENSSDSEITNVSVMFLLSVKPLIVTEEEFLEVIVILPTETYEEGFGPRLAPARVRFCAG